MLNKKLFILLICEPLILASYAKNKNYTQNNQVLVRDIDLKNPNSINKINEDYISHSFSKSENVVSFNGTLSYSKTSYDLIDTISETNIQNKDDIIINCAFDLNLMQFTLDIKICNDQNRELENIQCVTDAFITENGGLDSYVELDEDISFYISDFYKANYKDNCGVLGFLIGLAVIIIVYVAVAESAEQIKAKNNFDYNKQLEASGNGVNKGVYITNQNQTNYQGHNAGNYRFGFTTFGGVGCEVASCYNLMTAIGKCERLSDTIYSFEKLAIEYSIAWGNFGSSPNAIHRYLEKKNLNYYNQANFSKFESKINEQDKCHIIMSRWNKPFIDGLHTFYIEKTSSNSFNAYNWEYDRNTFKSSPSISSFNDGSGFIIGYVVWGK